MTALAESAQDWTLPRRLSFRFAFLYWLLYGLPEPLSLIPGAWYAVRYWPALMNRLGVWAGQHVFRLPLVLPNGPNGSGDTTLEWVKVACLLALAGGGALLWTLLERGRKAHPRLKEWLPVFVRLVLASAMIGYGMSKVVKTQFPAPHLGRLVQPYGESSPMGLLWTFMGYSTAYTVFAGAMEVAGGLLLLFRRTATLGALLVACVMINVVMLNFCYDVPVKLYSTHLLLMALWLLLPDLKRFTGLLLHHRTVEGRTFPPHFPKAWMNWTAFGVKTALFGFTLVMQAVGGISYLHQQAKAEAPGGMSGFFEVERFVKAGQEQPPLLTDGQRWRRIYLSEPDGYASVRTMTDQRLVFEAKVEQGKGSLILAPKTPGASALTCTFSRPDAQHLRLEGSLGQAPVEVVLKRMDPSQFLLMNRGFHWINETPFNR